MHGLPVQLQPVLHLKQSLGCAASTSAIWPMISFCIWVLDGSYIRCMFIPTTCRMYIFIDVLYIYILLSYDLKKRIQHWVAELKVSKVDLHRLGRRCPKLTQPPRWLSLRRQFWRNNLNGKCHYLHSPKLTNCPWKWMVGRRPTFGDYVGVRIEDPSNAPIIRPQLPHAAAPFSLFFFSGDDAIGGCFLVLECYKRCRALIYVGTFVWATKKPLPISLPQTIRRSRIRDNKNP